MFLFSSMAGKGFSATNVEGRLFVNTGNAAAAGGKGVFTEMWVHPGKKEIASVEVKQFA